MGHHPVRKAAKIFAATSTALLTAFSFGGTFVFSPGTWSNLSGTAASSPSLIETKSVAGTLAGSLSVKATSSGTQTIQGDWSFSVTWLPTTVGETPPANVKVTFYRNGTPTVAGDGVAKITSGTGMSLVELLKIDTTNNILSGITAYLDNKVVTAPLTLQIDGSYRASGTVSTELLSSTYNSSTSVITKCVESFSVANLEGVS